MNAPAQKINDADLTNALAYLAKHPTRYLFPLVVTNPSRPKGQPAIKNNLALASNDPAQLVRWYSEHRQRGRVLWGLSAKKSGIVPIDVDCGPGKVGKESFAALKAQNGANAFPATEHVLTPSGGHHLIYEGEHHFSTDKLGKNIDVPNYVLIAGTVLEPGRAYSLKDANQPAAKLPQWIADTIKPRRPERRNRPAVDPIPLDVYKKMLAATPYTGGPDGLNDRHSYNGWLSFAMECHEAAGGNEGEYLDAFIDWSLNDPNPDWTQPTSAEYIERKWQSFTDADELSAARTRGSWLRLLDSLGQNFVGDANPPESDFANDNEPELSPEDDKIGSAEIDPKPDEQAFPEPLSLGQLLGGKWSEIEYVLAGLIMKGVVNTFNADGGTGKTTLSTQIGVAVWLGREILGRKTIQSPVLLVLGEDGEWITQSRVEAQFNQLGIVTRDADDAIIVPGADLPPFVTWCLLGQDMTLARITDDGRIKMLPFYERLDTQLTKMGPGAFVVLDSLIDIVQMNMIEPMAVNAFFKRLLTGLCQKHDCTILVLAHPSKASMQDGSWVHGSLAMKNAVRNSIAMAKVEGKPYRRFWSLKHNYGPDDEMRLYFEKPLFTLTPPSASTNPEVRRSAAILDFIIEKIREGDVPVVHVNQAAGLTPRAIADLLNESGTFKPSIAWREVQTVMTKARLDGVLRYNPGVGRDKARYEWIDGEGAEAEPQPGDFDP